MAGWLGIIWSLVIYCQRSVHIIIRFPCASLFAQFFPWLDYKSDGCTTYDLTYFSTQAKRVHAEQSRMASLFEPIDVGHRWDLLYLFLTSTPLFVTYILQWQGTGFPALHGNEKSQVFPGVVCTHEGRQLLRCDVVVPCERNPGLKTNAMYSHSRLQTYSGCSNFNKN